MTFPLSIPQWENSKAYLNLCLWSSLSFLPGLKAVSFLSYMAESKGAGEEG